MNWNCEQIEARLSDYLDKSLDGADLLAFTTHTRTCERCGALVAKVGGLVTRMQALEAVEPPPRIVYNILDQTLGPRHRTEAPASVLGWLRWVVQPRFAMGVVAVVLTVVIMSQTLGIEWSKIERKDLAPASLYRAANSQAHLVYARGVKFVNDLRVVYEIQTRLETRPESQPQRPQPPPQRAPGSTESKPDPRRGRDLNRANELRPLPILLASAFGAPGRSVR